MHNGVELYDEGDDNGSYCYDVPFSAGHFNRFFKMRKQHCNSEDECKETEVQNLKLNEKKIE